MFYLSSTTATEKEFVELAYDISSGIKSGGSHITRKSYK